MLAGALGRQAHPTPTFKGPRSLRPREGARQPRVLHLEAMKGRDASWRADLGWGWLSLPMSSEGVRGPGQLCRGARLGHLLLRSLSWLPQYS